MPNKLNQRCILKTICLDAYLKKYAPILYQYIYPSMCDKMLLQIKITMWCFENNKLLGAL